MDPGDATSILAAHTAGDRESTDLLFGMIYDRLRALAHRYMDGERADHTLQPTALVHEAYTRMVDIDRIDWQGKTHFFAVAARQMRRILVEHARAAARLKRGERRLRVTLDEGLAVTPQPTIDLLAVDEALQRLARRSPRQSQVAELRLFSGMQVQEVAQSLGVSDRTVKQDWRMARAWLSRRLGSPRGRHEATQ